MKAGLVSDETGPRSAEPQVNTSVEPPEKTRARWLYREFFLLGAFSLPTMIYLGVNQGATLGLSSVIALGGFAAGAFFMGGVALQRAFKKGKFKREEL